MGTEAFFDETTEQSRVKRAIVTDYFSVWAKIISASFRTPDQALAYVDLFAGPGRYKDGTESTPLLVLRKALADHDLSQRLRTFFNDVDADKCRALKEAIAGLEGIEKLRYRPEILNEEVDEKIVRSFEKVQLIPTLFFIDPWGYKGLSLRLIDAVVRDWGCECVFFFNYQRINMGLSNPAVVEPMQALFGPDRAKTLREKLGSLRASDRELSIIEELCRALEASGERYVLPFRFKRDRGARTSHHLIFVSKHFLGYNIMKGVMAKQSGKEQGVANFEYNPADRRFPTLFELARPLEDLKEMLASEFRGRTVSFKELYERHSVGKSFVEKNYRAVLKELEKDGKITAPARKADNTRRKRGTFAKDVLISFSD